MKISDLAVDQNMMGLRLLSFTGKTGTVVDKIDKASMNDWGILWDGEDKVISSFYDNDCECELLLDEEGKPIFVEVK